MLRTSDNYQRAIAQPSRHLKSRLTINNAVYDDLDVVSFSLDEELFLNDSFRIGTASMSSIELMVKYSQRALESFIEDEEMKVEVLVVFFFGIFLLV
ncbi:MAG: hypothetical protein Q3980_16370 [Turicibacter sp.]|nr:hypothetical protein [Turicibacter sp.]